MRSQWKGDSVRQIFFGQAYEALACKIKGTAFLCFCHKMRGIYKENHMTSAAINQHFIMFGNFGNLNVIHM